MKKLILKIISLIIFIFVLTTNLNAVEYFISTTGNDSDDGLTEANAIATFTNAYEIMSGGDILTILDGTYNQQIYPPANLSGTESNYTTFRAKNVGEVVIAPQSEADLRGGLADPSSSAPVYVDSNFETQSSYFHFDGIFAKGVGENSTISVRSRDYSELNQMTHHIKITRCGSQGSGVDENTAAFLVAMSKDVLIEDCFSFGFARKPMQVFGSTEITCRRIVLRFDWWEGDDYKPNDPRTTMGCYNVHNSIFENIISFNAGPAPAGSHSDRSGLSASGNETPVTLITGSSNVQYLGCIVFNNTPDGFNGVSANGGSGSAIYDITFKDIVTWGNGYYGLNIHNNADGITLKNITAAYNGGSGIRIDSYPAYPITNVSVHNVVSINNGRSFWPDYDCYTNNCPNFNSVFSCSDNTAVNNDRGDEVEPEYLPTIVCPPTNTSIPGHPRGGIVVNRYVDGVLTDTPLWPWPYEEYIKKYMCDTNFLKQVQNAINTYDGTNITYMPEFAAFDGTLTEYIWQDCPESFSVIFVILALVTLFKTKVFLCQK